MRGAVEKILILGLARAADLFGADVSRSMRMLNMSEMEKVLMGLTDLNRVGSVCIK